MHVKGAAAVDCDHEAPHGRASCAQSSSPVGAGDVLKPAWLLPLVPGVHSVVFPVETYGVGETHLARGWGLHSHSTGSGV
eukprot:5258155-Prymnesium_polylepis.1